METKLNGDDFPTLVVLLTRIPVPHYEHWRCSVKLREELSRHEDRVGTDDIFGS